MSNHRREHFGLRRRTTNSYDVLAYYDATAHIAHDVTFGKRAHPPAAVSLPEGVTLGLSHSARLAGNRETFGGQMPGSGAIQRDPAGERRTPCGVCGYYTDSPCQYFGCPRH
jgi:hypothetical protein